ncbi:MAG TPA: dephospho-CoA kinase [Pirellulales bacterium]|nr:dephospho-CoA kinase [Pirellulales bacterium]
MTGGVASGKSFVARQFAAQCGAEVIDADRLGHEVLQLPEIAAAARRRWGDEIFSNSGQIDRRRLAERVFATTAEGQEDLRHLESLTHPRIREFLDKRLAELLRRSDVLGVIIDAPLLVEAGWNEFCDKIVFVEAPRAVRLARAAGRGWSEQDFSAREARQESCEVKRQLADVVIDNAGSEESTRAQSERAWNELIRPAAVE